MGSQKKPNRARSALFREPEKFDDLLDIAMPFRGSSIEVRGIWERINESDDNPVSVMIPGLPATMRSNSEWLIVATGEDRVICVADKRNRPERNRAHALVDSPFRDLVYSAGHIILPLALLDEERSLAFAAPLFDEGKQIGLPPCPRFIVPSEGEQSVV